MMNYGTHTWDIVAAVVLLWSLPWKGVALWKASRRGDKKWFIAMLILNTAAVLEIIYIFFVDKKKGEHKTD